MPKKSFYFVSPENKRPSHAHNRHVSPPLSHADQQQTFPYYSRTIPVLFPCYSRTIKPTMSRERAENKQRTSMTYQSTILENFCWNKTIVSVFVSKNNVKNQLLFAQFKEKQYLCPRNRRWGCGWGARRTDTERTKQKSTLRALRFHHIFW